MASGAPSVGLAIRASLQKYSSAIAAAGVSQLLLIGNENWNYIFIQNPSTAIESIYLGFDEAAAIDDTCMELLPGQFVYFKSPGFMTIQDINIIAATMGHKFICYAA